MERKEGGFGFLGGRNKLFFLSAIFAIILMISPAGALGEIYNSTLEFVYPNGTSVQNPNGGQSVLPILVLYVRNADAPGPAFNLTGIEVFVTNSSLAIPQCYNWNLWGLDPSEPQRPNHTYSHGNMYSVSIGGPLTPEGWRVSTNVSIACNLTYLYFLNQSDPLNMTNVSKWNFTKGYPLANISSWNASGNNTYSPAFVVRFGSMFGNTSFLPYESTVTLVSRGVFSNGTHTDYTGNVTRSFRVLFPNPSSRVSAFPNASVELGSSVELFSINTTDSSGVPFNSSRIIFNVTNSSAFSSFYVLNSSGGLVSANSSFSEGALSLSLGNSTGPGNFSIIGNLSQTTQTSSFSVAFSPKGGIEYSAPVNLNTVTYEYLPSPVAWNFTDANSSSLNRTVSISSYSVNFSTLLSAYSRAQTKPFNLTIVPLSGTPKYHLISPVSGFTIAGASAVSGSGTCFRNSTTLATCFSNSSGNLTVSINATASAVSGKSNWSIQSFSEFGANYTNSSAFETESQGPAILNVTLRTSLPANLTLGQTGVSVTFQVNNTGEARAVSVQPNVSIVHSNSSLAPISPPALSPLSIDPNSSVTFQVSFSIPANYSPGNLSVFLNATGHDANSLALVSAQSNSSNATVLRPATAIVSRAEISVSQAYLSRNYTISASILNLGESRLKEIGYSISPSSLGVSTGASQSALPDAEMGGFSNFSIPIFVSSSAQTGNISFNLTITGKDSSSLATISNSTAMNISIENPLKMSLVPENLTYYDVEAGKPLNLSALLSSIDGGEIPGVSLSFGNSTAFSITSLSALTVSGEVATLNFYLAPLENATTENKTRIVSIQAVSSGGLRSQAVSLTLYTIPKIICGGKNEVCCAAQALVSACSEGNLCCSGTCRLASEGKCCSSIWKPSFLCCADADCGETEICALNNGTCIIKPFGEPEANKLLSSLSDKLNSLEKRIADSKKGGFNTENPETILQAIDLKMRQARNLITEKKYSDAKKLIEDTETLLKDAETALASAPKKPSGLVFALLFLFILVIGAGGAGFYYMQKDKAGFSSKMKIMEKGMSKIFKEGLKESGKSPAPLSKQAPQSISQNRPVQQIQQQQPQMVQKFPGAPQQQVAQRYSPGPYYSQNRSFVSPAPAQYPQQRGGYLPQASQFAPQKGAGFSGKVSGGFSLPASMQQKKKF